MLGDTSLVLGGYSEMENQGMQVARFYDTVFRYIDGTVSLYELESWIAQNLNFLLSIGSIDLENLVNTIELSRAEMSEGHRTEEEFRSEIRAYIESHPTIALQLPTSTLTTSSSSKTQSASYVSESGEQVLPFSYVQL